MNKGTTPLDGASNTHLARKLAGDPAFGGNGHGVRLSALQYITQADLPTRYGNLTMHVFVEKLRGREHTVVVKGDVEGQSHVPLRVHSQCHTGDVWGSLRCDCRQQLEAALAYIAERDRGMIIYLEQEGRDIGLANKLKAYRLQDLGLDTVEANEFLGLPVDGRHYDIAAEIIRYFDIGSVEVLTNNPEKIKQLEDAGVVVAARVPVVIDAGPYNSRYLDTKRTRMGHIL